jgi:tetratricopeptide (TPR) repeat protein
MRQLATTLFIAALALPGIAHAQGARQAPPETGRAAPAAKPEEAPKSRIDTLFERLANATDETEAKGVAERIETLWLRSGSDTGDLLMTRVNRAIEAKDWDLALDLLDSLLALRPEWAEAWHRRSSVHFHRRDFDAAMRDLRQVLALEPRHFNALAGLGVILRESGNDKQALAAFRHALKLYPQMKQIKDAAERLAPDHDGRDI